MGYRFGTRTMGTKTNASCLDMPRNRATDDAQYTSTYHMSFVKGSKSTRPNYVAASTALRSSANLSMRNGASLTALSHPGMTNPSARMGRSSSTPMLSPGGGTPMIDGMTPIARTDTMLGFRPREARRALLETLADPDVEQIAREIFNNHDHNQSNSIEPEELMTVLNNLHEKLQLGQPSADTVVSLFKRFDLNSDKALSFKEFFELFIAELRRSAFDRSSLFGREFFVTRHPGRPWDTYERIKELGSGSFGTAFLCKHRKMGEDYVVKAVKKSRAKIPVEDIEKEIMVMRQVDHPHLVRLFEWYEDNGRIYLVLDALKGGTLKDVIMEFARTRRSLKESWTRNVTRQTMEAMSYCHNLRLIHKDIKDENLMLLQKDPNYEKPFVVIIDLGIAEMFSLSDPTGQECGGTPTTMAPEVWQGQFGSKCDVFSLGCVLFEMLAGTMPFIARTMKPEQWLRLHRRGADYTAIKTSAESKELCKSMLTFSDVDRPSMAECLCHDWFKADDRNLKVVPPEQFNSLQSFCQQAALKRTLLLEIASRLPIVKCGEIVELFETFDEDRDGTLTPEELRKMFKQIGITDKVILSKIFASLDVDNDGFLSFSEFAAGVLLVYGGLVEERLRLLFQEVDKDGDELLDHSEAAQLLENAALLLKRDAKSRSGQLLQELLQKGGAKINYSDLAEKLLGVRPKVSSRNR